MAQSFENQSTSDDTAVTVLAADDNEVFGAIQIINTGAAPGFFSVDKDGDGTRIWRYLPAYMSRCIERPALVSNYAIQIKRVAGGSNMTGVYGDIW